MMLYIYSNHGYIVKSISYAGISYHYYDVSFLPNHVVRKSPEVDNGIPYQTMFEADNLCTYLRSYKTTKPASNCKEYIKLILQPSEKFVHKTILLKDIIDNDIIQGAVQPLYSQPTYTHKVFKDAIKYMPPVKVIGEVQKNQYFESVIDHLIGDEFIVGHIKFPEAYKHNNTAYSTYGRSLNDLCIMHKENYNIALHKESYNISCVTFSSDDTGDDDDDLDDAHVSYGRSGTVEFKLKEYAIQQTIKEMLRNAGDLTAKILMEGRIVQEITIYGMAACYNTGLGKLLKLIIDFNANKSKAFCSGDVVTIPTGFNWLLKSIC